MSHCVFILKLFVALPSRLLRIVSTDFLALRLFCFNIRQHGRQILYFILHVDGGKFHYRRLHTAVRPQVVHRCPTPMISSHFAKSWHHASHSWGGLPARAGVLGQKRCEQPP